MRSDHDGDMTIDKKERDVLGLRLQIQLSTYGISLDVDVFNQLIEEDNSIGGIIKFCSEVLYPEIAMKRDDDQLFASIHFYDDLSSQDSEYDFFASNEGATQKKTSVMKTPSVRFRDFISRVSMMTDDEVKQEVENAKLSIEEKLNMFTVDDRYSMGSVECARGKKMSVMPSGVRKSIRHAKVERKTRGKAAF